MTGFDEIVRQATVGLAEPYEYQRCIANDGLPELLAVPTGSGKTMAAALGWLYRRRYHPDLAVRRATPRWLVFVLPMRTLVEQTHTAIAGWLANLGLDKEVPCHLLLGGESLVNEWRMHPDRDAVIVGTLDMIVSRALNRGYGATRYAWPVDFALFNAGCQFVFDEVQLMGPALATSRQLHGLRAKLGEAVPCRSMWMSATVAEHDLRTVDAPDLGRRLDLDDTDRNGRLARRLNAAKTVCELVAGTPKTWANEIAGKLADEHRPGTLTLAVTNTVARARELYRHLVRTAPTAEVVLLHSRFRPPERRDRVGVALAPVDASGPGRIVVSTQVVEAGVDISAAVLYTEAAPWPSIVQRAGRCNRDGNADDALLLWSEPPSPAPYPEADVAASAAALRAIEGEAVTPQTIGAQAVPVTEEIVAVLRRRDLLQLFDTQPDLAGNDIDVSRFIRTTDEIDVAVAWRLVGEAGPTADDPLPLRDERCPAPLGEMRAFLKRAQAWRWDHLDGAWRLCTPADLRPGMVVLLDAAHGGYDPLGGWDHTSKAAVTPIAVAELPSDEDRAPGDEPVSLGRDWQVLADHLADVARNAAALVDAVDPAGLGAHQRRAVVDAARLHDIGKAHHAFQEMVRATAQGDEPAAGVLLAKSKHGGGRYLGDRRYFRHELVSALALLGEGRVALAESTERDLVVYLVAAHHGRVRIGLRSLPEEGDGVVLGVRDGDELPAIPLGEAELPPSVIDLGLAGLDAHSDGPSWVARALALRDRPDLGPFRLAYLEALVRIADWRASAATANQRPGPANPGRRPDPVEVAP